MSTHLVWVRLSTDHWVLHEIICEIPKRGASKFVGKVVRLDEALAYSDTILGLEKCVVAKTATIYPLGPQREQRSSPGGY